MGLHCARGDTEALGDCGLGEVGQEEADDLGLARCQLVDHCSIAGGIAYRPVPSYAARLIGKLARPEGFEPPTL